MAVKKSSAEKRHQQSEVRRMRNKKAKSAVRTLVKKFTESCHAKDEAVATENLTILTKELDIIGRKGIMSKNTVSRKKSRMMKLYNVTFAK
ncbi:MAG TPA: 30S ribosomal protein S20 [Treponemataceae bacterium]|nr:30S ribosomal protein S20 [Treponemataceae bacterium]